MNLFKGLNPFRKNFKPDAAAHYLTLPTAVATVCQAMVSAGGSWRAARAAGTGVAGSNQAATDSSVVSRHGIRLCSHPSTTYNAKG